MDGATYLPLASCARNASTAEDPAVAAVRDLAAQYLLLYEMSLPFGLDLTTLPDIDKSASKFVVTLKNVSDPRH